MKSRKSKHRQVLLLTGWYSHPLHKGVVEYAHQAGWNLNNDMCYSGQLPKHWEGDGVLCRHSFRTDIIEMCKQMDVPMVGWEQDPRLPIPTVYFDQLKIGELAAQHLLDRGYRRLGFLHFGVAQFQLPRMEGFRKTAEAAGAQFFEIKPPRKAEWPLPREFDWEWLETKLEEIGLPLGIMVMNDAQSAPLFEALEEFSLSIPDDVAVIGAENMQLLCEMSHVPLSSVEANHQRMGYEAAALLDRIMDGEEPPAEPVKVEPGPVVCRESTNTLATGNAYAATALTYIWEHYREGITVADVAKTVPITRRRLQTLFYDDVGRTLQEELIRIRIEAACRHLDEGDLKVYEIAERSGFGGSLHLHRAFTNAFGYGPKAYSERGRPEGNLPGPSPLR